MASNGQATSPWGEAPAWLIVLATLLPAATSFIVTLVLVFQANLFFADFSDSRTIASIALIVIFVLTGLAVGYGMRFLLRPWAPATALAPTATDDSDRHRDRLARYVVTAGTIGIFVTALAIIIAVSVRTPAGTDWVQTALSIFSSILPVFATWVGTVLAFYFTNESFRQGAAAGQPPARGTDGEPITRAGTMIPFESVTRYELDAAAVANKGAGAAAEEIKLSDIEALFGPTGTQRVIIFDDKRQPLHVIRRTSMPAVVVAADTVNTYLETGTNRVDSTKFDRIAATATVGDARRLLATRMVADLFVTQNGRADEPVLGWVPDENLGRA